MVTKIDTAVDLFYFTRPADLGVPSMESLLYLAVRMYRPNDAFIVSVIVRLASKTKNILFKLYLLVKIECC
jgi:hypothetical protein